MTLLSRMFRTAAITGRTDNLNWFADRQGQRWAEQTVRAAFPVVTPYAQGASPVAAPPKPADPAKTLRDLTELRERGVLTTAEFEELRTRLNV